MKSFTNFLESFVNPVFKDDKLVDTFDSKVKKSRDSELLDILLDINENYKDFYEEVKNRIVKVIRPYIYKNKKTKLLTSIKPFDSVVDKTINRKKPISEINDLVRAAILFDTKEEVDQFVKDFRRKNRDIIVGYEEKEKGGDKVYGYYGSHHFDLDVLGLIAELQVMTRKLWNYKTEAHKIYVDTRSNEKGVPEEDSRLSKKIFRIANESMENEWEEVDIFEE